jgi:archaemetzincin
VKQLQATKPRRVFRGFVVFIVVPLLLAACDVPPRSGAPAGADDPSSSAERMSALRSETLPTPYSRLVPIAVPMGAAAAGGWLSVHDERGQSLAEFRARERRKPEPGKNAIVLVRLGDFTPGQDDAFEAATEMLEAFYGMPVRRGEDLDAAKIPPDARRPSRGYGTQIRAGFVLDSLLVPRMPPDAFALIALSAFDLYPQSSWNFVFGMAHPSQGVGVWSIVRFADPPEVRTDERPLLARTLRTATHEVGHLLGLAHCVTYRCLMNGSNSLEEHDDRPFELCPVCMAKVCESLDLDPAARAGRVEAVLRKLALNAAAAHERRVRGLLGSGAEDPKPDSS